MNGRRSRETRNAAHEAANIVGTEAAVALEKVVAYAVSIDVRTKVLEPAVARLESKARAWDALCGRSFFARLKWVWLGR